MDLSFREPSAPDWPSILEIANESVVEEPDAGPQDPWLANRRAFDEQPGRRHHFVAIGGEAGEVLGYGAVEWREDLGEGTWRLFVVTRNEHLDSVGAALYDRALDALSQENAQRIVFLEYERCRAIGAFAAARGLEVTGSFPLPNGPVAVRRERRL